MSYTKKRVLNESTNESKRSKYDSTIDLSFDIRGLNNKQSQSSHSIIIIPSESSIENYLRLDNDVFETEQCVITPYSKTSRNLGRSRLNGISTCQTKEKKQERRSECKKTERNIVNEALNKLGEEQTRIEAHSLFITSK